MHESSLCILQCYSLLREYSSRYPGVELNSWFMVGLFCLFFLRKHFLMKLSSQTFYDCFVLSRLEDPLSLTYIVLFSSSISQSQWWPLDFSSYIGYFSSRLEHHLEAPYRWWYSSCKSVLIHVYYMSSAGSFIRCSSFFFFILRLNLLISHDCVGQLCSQTTHSMVLL